MVAILKLIITAALLSQTSALAIDRPRAVQVDEPVLQHRETGKLIVGEPVLATRSAKPTATGVSHRRTVDNAKVIVGEPVLAVRTPAVEARAAAQTSSAAASSSTGKLIVDDPVLAPRPASSKTTSKAKSTTMSTSTVAKATSTTVKATSPVVKATSTSVCH